MRASLPVLAAMLLLSARARADADDHGADYDPGKAERRSDFAAGFSFNGAFGAANGYPNDAAKIGVDQYHAKTGAAAGEGFTLWLGGALRDWLVVGLGVKAITIAGSGTQSTGGSGILHLEAFPAFSLGRGFRDLAFVGDFGFGARKVNYASKEVADGGAVSSFSLGVLYEPIRVGKHLSGGPILQFGYEFSDTLSATLVTAGFQMAYYGGPG